MSDTWPPNSLGEADRFALYSTYSSERKVCRETSKATATCVGCLVAQHVDEHRGEAVDGVGVLTRRRREVLDGQREERPVGQRVAVEQEQPGAQCRAGTGLGHAATLVALEPTTRRRRPSDGDLAGAGTSLRATGSDHLADRTGAAADLARRRGGIVPGAARAESGDGATAQAPPSGRDPAARGTGWLPVVHRARRRRCVLDARAARPRSGRLDERAADPLAVVARSRPGRG